MRQCQDGKCATPCCDFCIHAYHEYFEDPAGYLANGRYIRSGPIGCILHYDERHQRTAQFCGYCDDFYCFRQYHKDKLGMYPKAKEIDNG